MEKASSSVLKNWSALGLEYQEERGLRSFLSCSDKFDRLIIRCDPTYSDKEREDINAAEMLTAKKKCFKNSLRDNCASYVSWLQTSGAAASGSQAAVAVPLPGELSVVDPLPGQGGGAGVVAVPLPGGGGQVAVPLPGDLNQGKRPF